MKLPDERGYFGMFGGRFVPELLMPALVELEGAYKSLASKPQFKAELLGLLRDYVGRPTPLFYARSLSKKWGANLWLKREDLCHSGAHKINNTIGQALLARHMGKERVIAETGAGQHGVAVATACALLGLQCRIYMGSKDILRQSQNVFRMKVLGAEVVPVDQGTGTLKDAINEAFRDWATNIDNTYYLIGSVVGPHPYPMMVRDFQSIIGRETLRQIVAKAKTLPDHLVACVGGGSNAIGLFYPFLQYESVKLWGVEAGGKGDGMIHSSTLCHGRPGILHGALSYLLHDEWGLILPTHSIAPGLDYPGVGPEHSFLKEVGRARYVNIGDGEAVSAFYELSEVEGIIPALESSHAVAFAKTIAKKAPDSVIVVNLSGRGDKDLNILGGSEHEQDRGGL